MLTVCPLHVVLFAGAPLTNVLGYSRAPRCSGPDATQKGAVGDAHRETKGPAK